MNTSTRWHAGAAALLIATSVVIAYARVIGDLVNDWASDPTYSHAFFVLPFAAWVVWDRRRELSHAAVRPHRAGILVIAASLALFAAGTLAIELFATRLSLIGLLAGAILLVFGKEHLRLVAFPLMLFALAIPLPAIVMNQIALPLQDLTSRGAAMLLGLCSVPVLREGNTLLLPQTALEVEEACSGLRSIVSLLTIGVIAGYLSRRDVTGRTVLALATIPIAVVASAIRVTALGIGAHDYGVDINHSPLHGLAGFSVFMMTCGLLFAIDSLLLPSRTAMRPEIQTC